MTEFDKHQRAKMYIDQLAAGIDPTTDTEMPHDSVLNNPRIVRCFFYISDILRQVGDNDCVIGKKSNSARLPFCVTAEQLDAISLPNTALPLTRFLGLINEAVCIDGMRKLSRTPIVKWLTDGGFLRKESDDSSRKRVGENGASVGMYEEMRTGMRGDYLVVLYSPEAQRFLLGNLPAILSDD